MATHWTGKRHFLLDSGCTVIKSSTEYWKTASTVVIPNKVITGLQPNKFENIDEFDSDADVISMKQEYDQVNEEL